MGLDPFDVVSARSLSQDPLPSPTEDARGEQGIGYTPPPVTSWVTKQGDAWGYVGTGKARKLLNGLDMANQATWPCDLQNRWEVPSAAPVGWIPTRSRHQPP